MPIRVAIFDDNKDRRESLRYLIDMQENMACCGDFCDCARVVEDVQDVQPDVVLMDIEMPNVNGIEGTRLIKSAFPAIVVLMQTVYEDDESLFESIKAGASGYLLKKATPEKIIEAIQDSLEGGAPMSPIMANKVLRFFKEQNSPKDYALTDREKKILSLLVEGLSYKMIADREQISFHTVNSHVRKIYEKLHVHSLGEAVSKALRERLL